MRLLLAAVLVALVAVPAAAAHVTLDPRKVPADSFARFDVRVPNETDDADTVSVTVQLPAGVEASYQPKPGWKRTVSTDGGATTVTWSGGRIAPGEFDEFGLSIHVPATPGQTLVFPALQKYSNGETVRWIGPADDEHPAPRVELTAAAAAAAEPVAGNDDGGGVALPVAIAALVVAVAALGLAVVRKLQRA